MATQRPTANITRSLGMAVREMFANSIVSHQGTFYETCHIDNQGRMLPIDEETYQRLREKLRLFDPTFINLLPTYPDRSEFDDEMEFLQAVMDKIRIQVPHSVQCYITEPLSMFRCSSNRCGGFYSLKLRGMSTSRVCPECRSEIFQAPLRVLKTAPTDHSATSAQRKPIQRITNTSCRRCSKGNNSVFQRLATLDPRSPFATLRLYCPDCQKPADGTTVARRGYTIQLPSQRLVRPVTQTSCKIRKSTPINLDVLSPQYINSVQYCDALEVFELVVGYSYPEAGLTYPLDVFNGRKFKTQGLVVEVHQDSFSKLFENLGVVYRDPALFAAFKSDLQSLGDDFFGHGEEESTKYNQDQIRRWTLHTLAHSLTMMLPLRTGIEASKFGYSYDVHDARVILYDNEEGGIGGSEMLGTNPDIWRDFLELTRDRLTACDCRARCPRCIVTPGCGEIYNALNRHLIGPIFGVVTDYE